MLAGPWESEAGRRCASRVGFVPPRNEVGRWDAHLAAAVERLDRLTPAERRLAVLVADTGAPTADLGATTGQAEQTARNMFSVIYRKLGIGRQEYGSPQVMLVRVMWAAGLEAR